MKTRSLVITDDGSSSLFVPELGEHYHSQFGAIQESQHIFIDAGLAIIAKPTIRILEFGFGTGLNAVLSFRYAIQFDKQLLYTTFEKYPLQADEYRGLKFVPSLDTFLQRIHQAEWSRNVLIDERFQLLKLQDDFRNFQTSLEKYDLVYYDAFAPDVQPHLWTKEIFEEIFESMNAGGILTTYTVKGMVRRALQAVGFMVEKIPGPIGKREITRAIKK